MFSFYDAKLHIIFITSNFFLTLFLVFICIILRIKNYISQNQPFRNYSSIKIFYYFLGKNTSLDKMLPLNNKYKT